MFKKWVQHDKNDNFKDDAFIEDIIVSNREKPVEGINRPLKNKSKNTILKGNKLIGDITVTCDLELSGEIVGNITSEKNSTIVIKGICKGNITTREGNIEIEGELKGGNITAGNNIKISGKFHGGEVKAQGRIILNGEFNGKIEASEIEIGPEARGTAEFFYKEYISISKGANIEGQICKLPAELTLVKTQPDTKKQEMVVPAAKKASGA
jgi:cytoskeletal protein CcmA (bactofilin family)